MKCPLDHSTLQESQTETMHSHRCEVCHGVFIEGEHFRQVKAQAKLHHHQSQSHQHLSASASQRLCPRRCTSMKVLISKGIEIDVCPQCDAIWLDSGELEKMILQYGHPKKQNLENLGTSLATIESRTLPPSKSKQTNTDALDVIDLVAGVFDLFN